MTPERVEPREIRALLTDTEYRWLMDREPKKDPGSAGYVGNLIGEAMQRAKAVANQAEVKRD